MIYFDTSFVAPLFVKENTSTSISTKIKQLPQQNIAISDWVLVEFSSLIARKVRMKELSSELATETIEIFNQTSYEHWNVINLSPNDFTLATQFIGYFQTNLRAGDALHLAVVSNRQYEIYTLDKGLIKAAEVLHIDCSSLTDFF